MSRAFDVVVWGATGFTGKLVAEYLAKTYTGEGARAQVRWAIAGRSKERLEKTRDELAAHVPAAKDVPILAVDPSDEKGLDSVMSQSKVVLTLAGPYAKYGKPVLESAVRCKTHYADITGETFFVRESIEKHHAKAKADGTCVVHCVGYDSIPWDVGTFLCAEYAAKTLKRPVTRVDALVGRTAGGFSGGTCASLLNALEDPTARASPQGAHCLDLEYSDKDSAGLQMGPEWNAAFHQWSLPSIMAVVNSKVVYRTAGLMPELYGTRGQFKYHEGTLVPNAIAAYIGSALFAVAFTAIMIPPTRWLLTKTVIPKPGEGPSKEMRENGCMHAHMVGTTGAGADGAPPKKVYAHFGIENADPGYKGTAMIATEAALCLALSPELPGKGGVLTPVSCMGMALVDRLRGAGFDASVRELEGEFPAHAELLGETPPAKAAA